MRLTALHRAGAAALLGAATACAKIEPPPGAPPDLTPPTLVATFPDSLAVLPDFTGDVEFRFDEVISEGGSPNRGTGTGGLEKLIILSPSTRVPKVEWHRSRIAVRPREGWQPNRVYRVELLSGVTDLRQNRSRATAVVTFTTGAPRPDLTLTGTAHDWTTGQLARGALIEAQLLPDTVGYRTVTDSSGAFTLGPLPRGSYRVYGVIAANRDLQRGPREAFDSAHATPESPAVDLWIFPHDTAGPRIQTIAVRDSLSALVSFTGPLEPAQRPDSAAVQLRQLPDSAPVPVVSLLPPALDSAAHPPPARAPADSAAAPADTARPVPALRPRQAPTDTTRRPPLPTQMVLRVSRPWQPGTLYLLDAAGIRNANGAAADVRGTLKVPEPPRPAADSTAADSTAADSTRAPAPPSQGKPRKVLPPRRP